MSEQKIDNLIDAKLLTVSSINLRVKELLLRGYKKIIIMHPPLDKCLLSSLSGNATIEIIGDVGSEFLNVSTGFKVIVNGDVGPNSLCGFANGKVIIYGSCSSDSGLGLNKSEVYIFKNCGIKSFCKISSNVKLVIGGICGDGFGDDVADACIAILNLKGGKIFIDDKFLKGFESENVFFRGDYRLLAKHLEISGVSEDDEDIYLPLISEYARLFVVSLNDIKSVRFNKVSPKKLA